MNKKGISPLIATVLIIGFTIVLAAVVMNWGGAFVRNLTETTASQAEAQTTCISINFDMQADLSTQKITVTNNKDLIIKDLLVQKINSTGSESLVEPVIGTGNEIGAYVSKSFTLTSPKSFMVGDKIRAIPYITLDNGEEVGCSADTAKTITVVA